MTTLANKLGATEGIYLNNTGIFKIQKTQRGFLFAKQWDEETQRFEGAPGVVNKIRPETKMTIEQAKHYGKMYGICMICGKLLTDENSIAAGIGPVCAGKF